MGWDRNLPRLKRRCASPCSPVRVLARKGEDGLWEAFTRSPPATVTSPPVLIRLRKEGPGSWEIVPPPSENTPPQEGNGQGKDGRSGPVQTSSATGRAAVMMDGFVPEIPKETWSNML